MLLCWGQLGHDRVRVVCSPGVYLGSKAPTQTQSQQNHKESTSMCLCWDLVGHDAAVDFVAASMSDQHVSVGPQPIVLACFKDMQLSCVRQILHRQTQQLPAVLDVHLALGAQHSTLHTSFMQALKSKGIRVMSIFPSIADTPLAG